MIKFYSYNLVAQDLTVISDPNENALFPLTNLIDQMRSKVYRSTTDTTSIVFDFISAEEVDSILFVPHKRNSWGFSAPVTIEANPTNSWGTPAFSTTMISSEIDQKHMIAIKELAAVEEYRFWRLTFTSTDFVEVAKVFIGKELTIGDRSISYGWSYQDEDNSTYSVGRYGQRFFDVTNRQKKFSARFAYLSKDEIDSFLEVYDTCGIVRPFFVRIACGNMSNEPNRFSGYVHFEGIPVITNPSFARYNLEFTLVEAT